MSAFTTMPLFAPFVRILAVSFFFLGCVAGPAVAQEPRAPRTPDVRYEPSEPDVVQTMVRMAGVKPGDVVFDLGCGDGRIVIAAVRQAQTRGVCVDIDPKRIAESRENALQAGVADRIEFRTQDLMETDLSGASVVMLFLSPELNLKVRNKLRRELKPGSRVVSHWHDMGDWRPLETVAMTASNRERNIYLWTIP